MSGKQDIALQGFVPGMEMELANRENEQKGISNKGYVPGSELELANIDTQVQAPGAEEDRGNWTGQLDFILSCIGYAVGLGNVWRFPYLCFRNGGGAFLIPYVIMLLLTGIPLFFFELSFGQFASMGPITIWKVSPLFRGVGFGMVIMSAMVAIYYNIIIMWSIYYMLVAAVSLGNDLPWQSCGNVWNTDKCYTLNRTAWELMSVPEQVEETKIRMNNSCIERMKDELGVAENDLTYELLRFNMSNCSQASLFSSPSNEYWHRHVLQLHDASGVGEIGSVSLKLAVFLFLSWLLIFFCLRKGVKSSGKVVYFTATFPYVVLIILLIRGVTLEGAYDGIIFYIFPVWEQLLEPGVWGDAAEQIFFSLGPGFGGLLTMSSYNKFKNNCLRDSLIVSFINCGTSVFAGFVIFSMLGYMSHNLNIDVRDVAVDGPGLVFIVYPEGIAQMPYAPVWAFLFFFMLLTLGLDSEFTFMETIVSAISDIFPRFLRKHKAAFTLICCFIGFLIGLPSVTPGGIYVFTIMNDYSAGFSLMVITFCELIAVSWVYGIKNFSNDVEMMLGSKPNIYFLACWTVLTPLVLLFIVVLKGLKTANSYYLEYVFEDWAQGIGWGMTGIPLLGLFGVMIYEIIKARGIRGAIKTHEDWGPALDKDRVGSRYPLRNTEMRIPQQGLESTM